MCGLKVKTKNILGKDRGWVDVGEQVRFISG